MKPINWTTWPLRGVAWTRRMWALLRELRTHEQHVLSVRDLIVRELRHNAVMTRHFERGEWKMVSYGATVRLDAWERHSASWSALRRKHPALWDDSADAYEQLRSVKDADPVGIVPVDVPTSQALDGLMRRLGEAKL